MVVVRRAAFALVFLFVFSIPWQDVIRLQGFGSISRLLGFVAFGVTVLATFRDGALHLRRLHLMLVGLISTTSLEDNPACRSHFVSNATVGMAQTLRIRAYRPSGRN